MAKKKKKKKDDEASGPSSPAWMTTYGDMMTLLLTFFVLLVSMSTTEIEKFKAAAASLKGALSVLPFQDRAIPEQDIPKLSDFGRAQQRRRAQMVTRLRRLIQQRNLSGLVRVQEMDRGVHIVIGNPALFDTGEAYLKPEYYEVLDAIIEIIKVSDQNIRVEGHTDNIPIHNAMFDNNWELSIARSLSVVRYIRNQTDIDPIRLRPVGCGEFHPVDTNETPEGRARNRRVEIFIEFSE